MAKLAMAAAMMTSDQRTVDDPFGFDIRWKIWRAGRKDGLNDFLEKKAQESPLTKIAVTQTMAEQLDQAEPGFRKQKKKTRKQRRAGRGNKTAEIAASIERALEGKGMDTILGGVDATTINKLVLVGPTADSSWNADEESQPNVAWTDKIAMEILFNNDTPVPVWPHRIYPTDDDGNELLFTAEGDAVTYDDDGEPDEEGYKREPGDPLLPPFRDWEVRPYGSEDEQIPRGQHTYEQMKIGDAYGLFFIEEARDAEAFRSEFQEAAGKNS